MNSLRVLYYANKNAWTSEIFKKWPVSWDMELQQKLRKIVLVLDNCALHHHLESLKESNWNFCLPHHIPGTANEHGNRNKFENLMSFKVYKLYP
jgi:hypothetical protein